MKISYIIVLFLIGTGVLGQEMQDTTTVSKPKGIVCYSTISKADFPLIIIDGVPADPDKELAIKPRQIAKITFLEGVHAALYGSRAAVHGVLLIETKKGKKEKGAKEPD